VSKQKHDKLKEYLNELGSVAIAFSSGVDSTFLLKTAHEALGDNVIAVTATSGSYPKRELNEAIDFCKREGIRHILCESEELDIEGFSENPPNRCYLCKTELFNKIRAVAKEHGIDSIAEGSNMDDNNDYRPGHIAIHEQGIKSPLRQVGLTKDEIRTLSKEMGLPTWNKQSFACLTSRFPYGETISKEKLDMVDKAEQLLLEMGLRQVRVRHHGDLARIETDDEGFAILFDKANRELIHAKMKKFGFKFASIDLVGYKMGSMNATIPDGEAMDVHASINK
jgi:uncharacterized protein